MQKSIYSKNRAIGISGLLLSVILILGYNSLMTFLISLGESLSPDGQLIPESIFLLKESMVAVILLIIGISLLYIFNLAPTIPKLIQSYVQLDKAEAFFLTDQACGKKRLSFYVLVVGTGAALLLQLYVLAFYQPPQEGAMEKYTTLLFPIAASILVLSIFKVSPQQYDSKPRKKIIGTLMVLALLLLLVFGEEISWGQQFFGWESTGVFEEYNFQQETNIHNFFNPIFQFLYPAVGMGMFLVLFFVWFFPQKESTDWFKLFFPHQSLFFIAFIMACSTFYGHSEAFEELLAIFLVLYSVRILVCLQFPGIALRGFNSHGASGN